jgi:putative acetyltransferase
VSEAKARAALIRPRRDEDWPALLDLWVASWRATYPEIDFDARRDWLIAHIRALENAGAATLVFEEAGALAGFVTLDPVTQWLDQLCVAPTHFGAGAATRLMTAAKGASRERIGLDVNADNARALRFYAREGFTRIGAGRASLSGRATVVMEWRAPLISSGAGNSTRR